MQVNINDVNYKFLPSKITNFDNIVKNKLILKNDIYEKYNATALIDGDLIVCNNISLMRHAEKKIVREKYDDYLINITKKRHAEKDQWIYNIIEGISEQESILYRDHLCVIIPTYMWDDKNIDKLHILCIPTDISLRCIRSLNSSHIPLLEHIKIKTLELIKNRYDLDEHHIKMYFHYEPSTYHLHIHFVNTAYHESRSSVEYSHELNSVLFNLSICSDYYKLAILNKRV